VLLWTKGTAFTSLIVDSQVVNLKILFKSTIFNLTLEISTYNFLQTILCIFLAALKMGKDVAGLQDSTMYAIIISQVQKRGC